MSALNKKSREINLLPLDKFAASPTGRILAWLLKSFRVIVMVVEMVVMIAFLSRFWLDAKNSDLNDEIKQKQALIEAQSDFEKEFRLIQDKLKIYSQIDKSGYSVRKDINTLAMYTPTEVFLTSLNSSPQNIQIKGFSPFERSISQLIVNLQNSGDFSQVELTTIDTQSDEINLLEFGLSATRKEPDAEQLEK